jgi:hypothetical protein
LVCQLQVFWLPIECRENSVRLHISRERSKSAVLAPFFTEHFSLNACPGQQFWRMRRKFLQVYAQHQPLIAPGWKA